MAQEEREVEDIGAVMAVETVEVVVEQSIQKSSFAQLTAINPPQKILQ
jgi:hypothetical protein